MADTMEVPTGTQTAAPTGTQWVWWTAWEKVPWMAFQWVRKWDHLMVSAKGPRFVATALVMLREQLCANVGGHVGDVGADVGN
eukprot:gene46856-37559_t